MELPQVGLDRPLDPKPGPLDDDCSTGRFWIVVVSRATPRELMRKSTAVRKPMNWKNSPCAARLRRTPYLPRRGCGRPTPTHSPRRTLPVHPRSTLTATLSDRGSTYSRTLRPGSGRLHDGAAEHEHAFTRLLSAARPRRLSLMLRIEHDSGSAVLRTGRPGSLWPPYQGDADPILTAVRGRSCDNRRASPHVGPLRCRSFAGRPMGHGVRKATEVTVVLSPGRPRPATAAAGSARRCFVPDPSRGRRADAAAIRDNAMSGVVPDPGLWSRWVNAIVQEDLLRVPLSRPSLSDGPNPAQLDTRPGKCPTRFVSFGSCRGLKRVCGMILRLTRDQ